MKLEWTAPPPEAFHQGGTLFYMEVAAALREHPGEWAVIPREFATPNSAKNGAATIRTGRNRAMPKGEFEAVAHERVVYARYVGEKEDDEEGTGPGASVVPIGGPVVEKYDPVKVREWAQSVGIEVSKHGRLPQSLIQKYEDAQKAEQ